MSPIRMGCGRALVLAWVAVGCTGPDPRDDYARAAREAERATGTPVAFETEREPLVAEAVDALLRDGLSRREAVRTALRHEPGLQEMFLRIGTARAALYQAGLLSNPSLGALIRFPLDGGSGTVEGGLAQNLMDLLRIPVEKRSASRRLEAAVLEAVREAARLAARVRKAYVAVLEAETSLAVEEENLRTVEELLELTERRQEAGDATEVDVNLVRADRLRQDVSLRDARRARDTARVDLVRLLGIDVPPGAIRLADDLPGLSELELSEESLLDTALAARADLRGARRAVDAAREDLRLERRRIFRRVEPGVALEGEVDDLAVGPSVKLELPLFDQNQAGIAAAELDWRRARRRLESARLDVVAEVRRALAHYRADRAVLRDYEERLLPLEEENLELAREAFRLGRVGFLSVLDVQREVLRVRRRALERRRAWAEAVADLEAAVGRPFRELRDPGAESGAAGTPQADADVPEKDPP